MRSRLRVPVAASFIAVVAALSLGIASAPLARAQQVSAPVDVRTHLDIATATLGQHITLTVVVRHAQSLLVTIARPAAQSDLDIAAGDPQDTVPDATGAQATTTATFVLAPFALGDVSIPPIRVSWLRSDGTTGAVSVQPPAIPVTPIRTAGDDALRPLKPQVAVGGAPPAWLRAAAATAVGGVVLATVAAVALWRRRRRLRAASERSLEPDVTPEQRARARLDGLLLPSRNTADHYQHFYGTISLAVRSYLEDRFGFNATALTTTELERRMTERGVGRWQARLVAGLLDRCDGAVYAHDYPDPASADHDLTLAYEIVELSRPHLEPSGPEPAVRA